MNNVVLKEAQNIAWSMMDNAYVPYSHFRVGAAVIMENGEIFGGCNIENASYGLTNCGERTAIFKAVSEGNRNFAGLVIVGNTEDPTTPCGACRQVISEFFAKETPIYLMNIKGAIVETNINELLPGSFKSSDM